MDAFKTGRRKENKKQRGSEPRAQWEARHSAVKYRNCLVHTQLFGTRQQVLLIRQDVVEDKKLGGDGVALSSSSTALPLLPNSEREKQNNS